MSKNRLLFISANRNVEPYPVYPLGISYLTTYLYARLPETEIRIIDLNLESVDSLKKTLADYKPHYTGISLRNVDDANSAVQECYFEDYRELVDTVRKYTESVIIIGGAGFSIFPERFYRILSPDFGITGEGEESLLQLLRCLAGNRDFTQIEGLVYSADGKIRINKRTRYLKELDLEFPDSLVAYYWVHGGMLNMQTKRGCPFHCVYCSYPVIEGHIVRTLDADKIVSTLRNLSERMNINYVFFTDSVFNICREYNRKLAEKIIEAGLSVKWGAYFSPHNLDMDTLKLLQDAGLRHIEFGTESIAEATLKSYRKPFSVDDILSASDNCNRLGIYYAHFLILAGLGETDETIDETFKNSKKINNSVFFPYIGMRIYPGTLLYEAAVKEGVISSDDDLLVPKYYI
ncbi:MAG: radical SAM protein [Bacteroidetes bacterium]|nr:radical SAM protein [Bacteroidota bacterium]